MLCIYRCIEANFIGRIDNESIANRTTLLKTILKTNVTYTFDYIRCVCINKFQQCEQHRRYYLELPSIEICKQLRANFPVKFRESPV